MSFNGHENHSITLAAASALTSNYRANNPGKTKAHYFGKDAIQAILDQEGCVGIRIYYGENANGEDKLVLCGVTSDENDMYTGELAQHSITCPFICGNNNPLNS